MIFPTKKEIVYILKKHPLVKFEGKVKRAFVIGSFAKGKEHSKSDIDILLEVYLVEGYTENELTQHYRKRLAKYFMENNITETRDEIHPQWSNRRIDLYLTYNNTNDFSDKIELS